MTGNASHGDKATIDQWSDLKRAARNAEWNVPEGRLGDIVRQLRCRGEAARRRASWILALLVFVIFIGLLFYLGLPFWQQFADGRKQTLTQHISDIETRLGGLDRDRETLKTDLSNFLHERPEQLRAPDGNGLNDPLQVGEAIYISSFDYGGVWRAAQDGASFEELKEPNGMGLNAPVQIGEAIYITGFDHGGVWRAAQDGEPFEELRAPDGNGLNGPVQIGEAIYITGQFSGGIWRAAQDGASFEELKEPNGMGLNAPVQIGEAIYITGFDHGGVWRAAQDGEPFEELKEPDGTHLYPPVQAGEAIYIAGPFSSGVWRSARDGAPFEELKGAPDVSGFNAPVQFGEAIYITDYDGGGIWRATQDGTSLEELLVIDGDNVNNPVQIGEAIYITGQFNGGVWRLAHDSTSFDELRAPDGNGLNNPVQIGEAIYITEQFGSAVWRLAQESTSPEKLLVADGNGFYDPVQIGEAVYITGQLGGVWRAKQDGAPFVELLVPDGVEFNAPVQAKATIYFMGSNHGGVWKLPSSLPERVMALESDAKMRDFFDTLQLDLKNRDTIKQMDAELRRIEIERAGLHKVRSSTQDRRDRFDELPWAVLAKADYAMSFDQFLEKCRAPNADSETLTKTCLETWQSNQEATESDWWETLSTQVPPGILLLFLLGTLAALYRYNMRLAGFHHSRADILELHSAGFVKPHNMDDLSKLAAALAADNVSFGKMQVGFGTGSIGIERAGSPSN
ncbi:hypothetical protein ROA7450_02284 [Roseovarius albus]|uniref:Uncharacterized protein n=1 Tax=Roseovarius albus TaxID=1247867 RepID=A0A1X6ZBN9_9RHOB|nr:hypothetical protein [Roseovarius albus]SLN46471.1 hypothetical protein ROA7450_02284 [Roseovarius albus]